LLLTLVYYTMAARGGGRPRIGFEQFKDIIHNLYIVDYQPLDDVRRYMKSRHNFESRYTYIAFFKFTKNTNYIIV
jgi:uncharacterized protein (DUF488 family)